MYPWQKPTEYSPECSHGYCDTSFCLFLHPVYAVLYFLYRTLQVHKNTPICSFLCLWIFLNDRQLFPGYFAMASSDTTFLLKGKFNWEQKRSIQTLTSWNHLKQFSIAGLVRIHVLNNIKWDGTTALSVNSVNLSHLLKLNDFLYCPVIK